MSYAIIGFGNIGQALAKASAQPNWLVHGTQIE
jgi:predicted dinucleotide-binding enzyme